MDAGERQVTADRSLAALPPALQSIPLFEAFGELIDAAGGMLEFSDLLKRPLDAFKYLQITAETGEVALRSQNIQVNCVMLASGNELHLTAFREHPEFESFRGRLELIKAPYLSSWMDEQRHLRRANRAAGAQHVAPHATRMAAMFSVLTRMRKPNLDRYEKPLRDIVGELSAVEKVDLYATGTTPTRLDDEHAKLLRASIKDIYHEVTRTRSTRAASAQARERCAPCCSTPRRTPDTTACRPWPCWRSSMSSVRRPANTRSCRRSACRAATTTTACSGRRCTRVCSTPSRTSCAWPAVWWTRVRYSELFERYVTHVSFWVKHEKLRNPMTASTRIPDERMMREVEALIGGPGQARGAPSLADQRDRGVGHRSSRRADRSRADLRPAATAPSRGGLRERRVAVAKLSRDIAVLLREGGSGLDFARQKAARRRSIASSSVSATRTARPGMPRRC